jgi:hypothetical protein
LAVKSFLIEARFVQPQAGETGRWAVSPERRKKKAERKIFCGF